MRHIWWWRGAVIVLAVIWHSGCLWAPNNRQVLRPEPEVPTSAQMSLAFGYIDMTDAEPGLQWIRYQQLAPTPSDNKLAGRTKDGLFLIENLAPGSYQIFDFGGRGGGLFAKGYLYASYPLSFPVTRQSGHLRVTVSKPGIYFMGAYKYVNVRGNRVGTQYEYALEPLTSPNQRELLERLLQIVKGTGWESRVAASLKSAK